MDAPVFSLHSRKENLTSPWRPTSRRKSSRCRSRGSRATHSRFSVGDGPIVTLWPRMDGAGVTDLVAAAAAEEEEDAGQRSQKSTSASRTSTRAQLGPGPAPDGAVSVTRPARMPRDSSRSRISCAVQSESIPSVERARSGICAYFWVRPKLSDSNQEVGFDAYLCVGPSRLTRQV